MLACERDEPLRVGGEFGPPDGFEGAGDRKGDIGEGEADGFRAEIDSDQALVAAKTFFKFFKRLYFPAQVTVFPGYS